MNFERQHHAEFEAQFDNLLTSPIRPPEMPFFENMKAVSVRKTKTGRNGNCNPP